MKLFISFICILILAACNFSGNQNRSYTKSYFVSDAESKPVENYFSPFNSWIFSDSIKVNFNVTKDGDYNNLIDLSFITPSDTINTKLTRQGGLSDADANIFIDISKSTAFILWITEPFFTPQVTDSRHSYELHLKSIDLQSGKEYFEKKIYSTKCCIDRLSMIFNQHTSSILIAYNDFSRDDSNYLMYGFININKNNLPENNFKPVEIIAQDKSEKRFPDFIWNKKQIYLYHSSGDRWGAFNHSGKAQIGISTIDNSNMPTDYKILMDSLEIETKLFLKNDTLFYRVRIDRKNQPDEMKIKKAAINDLNLFKD